MAWSPRFVRLALLASLLPAIACGDDGADDTAAESTAASTSQGTASTTTDGTATSTSQGSTGATASETAAAESTTGPGEPVACGEALTCDPGQICVVPCCGGPAPGCMELQPGEECDGTIDEGGVQCCQSHPDPPTCMMSQWCIPGPCTPDPVYCVPAEQVTCNEFECTVEGGCFGMLFEDGTLHCGGCK